MHLHHFFCNLTEDEATLWIDLEKTGFHQHPTLEQWLYMGTKFYLGFSDFKLFHLFFSYPNLPICSVSEIYVIKEHTNTSHTVYELSSPPHPPNVYVYPKPK